MKDALKEFASKIAENPIALLILLGTVLVVLAAAGGVTYKDVLPITDKWARLSLGASGIALAALGIILAGMVSGPAKPYGISILTPNIGDEFVTTTVRGSIRKAIPPGHVMWVLRFYPDGQFVPLHTASIDIARQTWVAHQCAVGGTKGDVRYFVAALVGPNGQALLDYFFVAHERHNIWMDQLNVPYDAPNRFLPPISKPVEDIIECDRVSVRRA
jgi:hypothetical protein